MIAKGGGHDTEPRRRPCVRKLSGEPLDRTDLPVPLAKPHAFGTNARGDDRRMLRSHRSYALTCYRARRWSGCPRHRSATHRLIPRDKQVTCVCER